MEVIHCTEIPVDMKIKKNGFIIVGVEKKENKPKCDDDCKFRKYCKAAKQT